MTHWPPKKKDILVPFSRGLARDSEPNLRRARTVELATPGIGGHQASSLLDTPPAAL